MSTSVNLKDSPAVKALIKAVAPDYRKKEAYVKFYDTVSVPNSYWDGGSRRHYYSYNRKTDAVRCVDAGQAPSQFGGAKTDNIVALDNDTVVVSVGICEGKPAIAYVYMNRHLAVELNVF